jgi:hypothetical protein
LTIETRRARVGEAEHAGLGAEAAYVDPVRRVSDLVELVESVIDLVELVESAIDLRAR